MAALASGVEEGAKAQVEVPKQGRFEADTVGAGGLSKVVGKWKLEGPKAEEVGVVKVFVVKSLKSEVFGTGAAAVLKTWKGPQCGSLEVAGAAMVVLVRWDGIAVVLMVSDLVAPAVLVELIEVLQDDDSGLFFMAFRLEAKIGLRSVAWRNFLNSCGPVACWTWGLGAASGIFGV